MDQAVAAFGQQQLAIAGAMVRSASTSASFDSANAMDIYIVTAAAFIEGLATLMAPLGDDAIDSLVADMRVAFASRRADFLAHMAGEQPMPAQVQ